MKKALAALLALVLLVAMVPSVAMAEGDDYVLEIKGGQISENLETVDGQECLKVEVWINGIDDNHLLASANFSIGYDSNLLTYVSNKQGSLVAVDKNGNEQGAQSLIVNGNTAGKIGLAMASAYGCRITEGMPLITLYFKLSDSFGSADAAEFTLGAKPTAESVVMTDQVQGSTTTTKRNLTADFKPYLMVAPKFKTHSLVLSGQIGLNFFMDLPSIEGVDYTKSYMTFDISGKGTCTARDNYDPNYMNGSKTYYGFTCYINSIQMADKITATFHYGDGQTIEETYSVKDYFILFDQNASAFNTKTKNLIQSIADFGHYVQLFLVESGRWTLGTDYAEMDHYYKQSFDLNAIGSAVAKYAVVRDNKTNGDLSGVPSYALMLDSETSIKAFFTPASGYTGSLKVTIDGKNATVKKDGNRFYVQTSGISAHKLGEAHTIVATTDHGTATIKVSALSYVDTVLKATTVSAAAKNAVAAIYCYYEAVMAYRA